MKERPILFSGPMVRAILEGRKTQTRRVVMPQPSLVDGDGVAFFDGHGQGGRGSRDRIIGCPYGAPGDRLWVRETWGLFDTQPSDGPERATVFYRADPDLHPNFLKYQLWRPSIHIPRWASRLTLEVTGVRVQRVQEISEVDAAAEGAGTAAFEVEVPVRAAPLRSPECHKAGFAILWDSINAKRGYGWDANPWVWMIELQRIEP